MKVLLDTNIILDVLLDRKPHSPSAAAIFSLAETGVIQGYLCATTVTTLDYLLTQALEKKESRKLLRDLIRLFEIAPVNRSVIEDSLTGNMPDFEDAVLDQAAQRAGIDVIVTRNAKDFTKAQTTVMDPYQFLAGMT